MTFDPNDPRLTAYALGELEELERAVVEAQLRECPTSRQWVEEVKQTAAWLSNEFSAETGPGLDQQRLQAIEKKMQPSKNYWGLITFFTLAAGVVFAISLFQPFANQNRQVAGEQRSDRSSTTVFKSASKAEEYKAEEREAVFPAADLPLDRAESMPQVESAPAGPLGRSGLAGGGGIGGGADAGLGGVTDSLRSRVRSTPQSAKQMDRFGDGSSPVHESARVAKPKSEANRESLSQPAPAPARSMNPRPRDPASGAEPSEQAGAMANKPNAAAMPTNALTPAPVGAVTAAPSPLNDARSSRREIEHEGFQGRAARDESRRKEVAQEAKTEKHRFNTDEFVSQDDNSFQEVPREPLSTFSIDVDTASYSLTRRFLKGRQMPPPGAVRIEEMVNYFPYAYKGPTDEKPFAVHVEVSGCPWNPAHRLARIGLKGKELRQDQRPASNLVFLVDVSGSMSPPDRLPLLTQGLKLLVNQLGENDKVAIVVYAAATGLVLDSTQGYEKQKILDALDRLQAGGSTNGGAGIQLAYNTALANFIPGGVNRVILCTDGDFNVGVTSTDQLVNLVAEKAKANIFLTVLGFGMGNNKDHRLQSIADKGNGNHAYIDDLPEAKKVLVEQMGGTLVTIAKDVKIQVEFNPAWIGHYRLIGYENRMLKAEDFRDDKKDAGEIGAGHTVTALYELVPAGMELKPGANVEPLKYQKVATPLPDAKATKEILTVKLRYKQPEGTDSTGLEVGVVDEGRAYHQASSDFKFAAAVASFGMLLRNSPHKGNATYGSVAELAAEGKGEDKGGYRAQFLELVRLAQEIKGK